MIDLHMHSTASDGRYGPPEVARRVYAAGVGVFALTDHDTGAGLAEAGATAASLGLTLVPGIEVTAVWAGRDVHVLGYWIDAGDAALGRFLETQRGHRLERVHAIAEVLARIGAPVDLTPLVAEMTARPGTAVGRPRIARALVEAGHAVSVQDAFDRYLAEGQPAYVPRTGVPPLDAVAMIHAAGGLASLAHPGVSRCDDHLAAWAAGGLDALEAYHPDHDQAATARYLARAGELGLLVTGGSDFHDDDPASARAGRRRIGGVPLPEAEWQRLYERRPQPRPS